MEPFAPPSFAVQEEEPSVLAYGLQQVGVPLGSLLVLLVVPGFSWSFAQSSVFGQAAEVIRCLTIESLTGLLFGFAVGRIMPDLRTTGKWVWVIPVSLIALGLLQDSLSLSINMAVREFFFPGPDGEGWWAFALLTCPAAASVWYSAVVSRRWRMSADPPLTN